MKKIIALIYLAFALTHALAQKPATGSLRKTILSLEADSTTAIPDVLGNLNVSNNPDSSIFYARQLIAFGSQRHNQRIISLGYNIISYSLYNKGNFPGALNMAFQSLRSRENSSDKLFVANTYNVIGNIYKGEQNYPKALFYYRRCKQAFGAHHLQPSLNAAYFNMAFVFEETGVLDSALYYARMAAYNSEHVFRGHYMGYILGTTADVYLKQKKYKLALQFYQRAYAIDNKKADFRLISINGLRLARFYHKTGKPDSAIYYAKQSFVAAKKASYNKSVFESTDLLARLYEAKHQTDSSFKYLKISAITKDSLYNSSKSQAVENLTTDEFLRQNEIQAAEAAYHARLRIYALIFTVLVFAVAGFLQRRNSLQRKKSYVLLQKQNAEIEAQKAEARVEVALERVRSRTMGMQRSDELQGVALLLFHQAEALGVNAFACGFNIWDDDRKFATAWMGSVQGLQQPFKTDSSKDIYLPIYEAAQRGDAFFVREQAGEELKVHYDYLATIPIFRDIFMVNLAKMGFAIPSFQIIHCAFFTQGYLMFISYEPCPEAYDIFKRFAKVFEQTYTRFLDLKKAEEQAMESQIQLAMERVRARTMAMQKSNELTDVASLLFEQVSALGIKTWTAGFNVWSEDNNSYVDYITSPQGGFIEPYTVLTETAEALRDISNARKSGVEFDVQYVEGEKIKQLYLALTRVDEKQYEIMLQDGVRFPSHQYEHFVFGSKVSLMFITYEPVPEAHDIFKRLGKVFEQTYTRFLDLKKAEAQTREAVRQASVDRVRAEIASMRATDDLERITPLIWDELIILGIPFIRCGVFIIDEQEQLIHTHLSTADGKALAAFDLQFDAGGIGQNVLPAWRKKQIATIHWTEEEFATYTNDLVEQGSVKPDERYVTEHPNTTLDLHFIPFLQGMLYVGNTSPLTGDEINIVQSLADAFSTAYARYEDFNKLEAAKKQVDITLTELKTAQTQLVQTEKMASLGELTAGIAHEIQNPLNFVNNFSEVNVELIEEMEEEIDKGNLEDVKTIAANIKENQQKISQHGKRADFIVKGMLQHSRTNTGERQETNINLLADEFLKLSYHGFRAKDKNFNAELLTNFDENLPKVNIVQQDIGRVMLNLFNNAFYAVNQKRKTAGDDYKPEVTVSTSVDKTGIHVSVKDNGYGIPESIKDKIMQPFFTTKPTGEGTGLGLSLSYDIVVKGHSGKIEVITKEGEFTEFVVTLPV